MEKKVKIYIPTTEDIEKESIITLCQSYGYNYHVNYDGVNILEEMTPNEIADFIDGVNKLTENAKEMTNIKLSAEQTDVLNKALEMLNNANIGLAYLEPMGLITAYNVNPNSSFVDYITDKNKININLDDFAIINQSINGQNVPCYLGYDSRIEFDLNQKL